MDANRDGRITKNEASEDLKLFFAQYDANKDGAIDVKEAQALVKYANREQAGSSEPAPAPGRVTAKQIISYMDKNGDGKLGKDEASKEVKANFQFIDTNGDGVIDVKEAQVMADYANKAQDE
jgi:Ca2+-binding EF-hand superfamily protein